MEITDTYAAGLDIHKRTVVACCSTPGAKGTPQAELEQALVGYVRAHHRFLLARHLIHIDFLDEKIARFEQAIETTIASQSSIELPPAALEPSPTSHASSTTAPRPSTPSTPLS